MAMTRTRWVALVAAGAIVLATTGPANAAKPEKSKEIPKNALYRYTNSEGRLVISNTLPREAIYIGYEIVTPDGRVVKTVGKALPEEERIRLRDELRETERDKALLKLYPTPEDAERASKRQIAAIQLKITYAQNNIASLNSKLSEEVSDAAKYEKKGLPVPENTQKSIDQLSGQIHDEETMIEKYKQDIGAIAEEYDDIVKRLKRAVSAINED